MDARLTALLLAAVALVGTAEAQTADTLRQRPTVTVPLPGGSGEFYFRAGTPGGVLIQTPPTPAPPASVSPRAEPVAVTAPRPRTTADPGGLSRLDLLLLEQNLMDAMERRYGRNRPAAPAPPLPPLVVPAAPAAIPRAPTGDAPIEAEPSETVVEARLDPPDAVEVPGPVTSREVERSILETGLFRTTAVHFEFARAELLPVSSRALDVVADVLLRYPALRIEVGGHTDNVGSTATNRALSQRRADAVVGYLVSVGVAPGRLRAVGYGKSEPVADNGSETGRALNRRVEFAVLNPEAAARETVREVPRDATGADDLRDLIRQEMERMRDDG